MTWRSRLFVRSTQTARSLPHTRVSPPLDFSPPRSASSSRLRSICLSHPVLLMIPSCFPAVPGLHLSLSAVTFRQRKLHQPHLGSATVNPPSQQNPYENLCGIHELLRRKVGFMSRRLLAMWTFQVTAWTVKSRTVALPLG